MRRQLPIATLYLVVAALAFSLGASCTTNKRTETLQAALFTVNTARDKMTVADREHQGAIIAAAQAAGKTRDQVKAELAAYREKRDVVEKAFEVVYRAIASAATADDRPSLDAATKSAFELVTAVSAFSKELKTQGGP